ncbi:MAG: hypothetical protein RR584_16425, partial [Comamonas sp.]
GTAAARIFQQHFGITLACCLPASSRRREAAAMPMIGKAQQRRIQDGMSMFNWTVGCMALNGQALSMCPRHAKSPVCGALVFG